VWQEKLRPTDKADLRKFAVVNHPNGSVDRVYNSYRTDNGQANGNVLYHLDRYLNKDLDLNHPIGIQHRDARNNKVGQPYKLSNMPGLDLQPDGNVKFIDKEGNRHRIGPDHRELVLNTNDQIYLKKDTAGRIIESGGLVVTNPAASFADRVYKMDELNHSEYRYSAEDNTVQIMRTVDGKQQPPTSLNGLMYPNGELWHPGNNGTMIVERPDSSTITIHPKKDGKSIEPTTYSYSNSEIISVRQTPDGPDEADFAIDVLHHKASRAQIETRLRAMSPDEAQKLGLTAPFQHYYLTRSKVMDGKEEPLIGAPKFDTVPQSQEQLRERQEELKMVFINPELLANGSIQATTLTGEQVRFNLPKTPQDLLQPTFIDTATHLTHSKEKFESLIIKHRQQFEAMLREGKTFPSGPLMSTSDPRWIENWAATQFHIQLPPRVQPTSPAQAEDIARRLAFSYDAGIATILANQNRTPRQAQPFMPPAAAPGSRKPETWNDVIDQLKKRDAAKTPKAQPDKSKPSPPPPNPQSPENWDSAARGLGLFFKALIGR
jgi:hypothetical protein